MIILVIFICLLSAGIFTLSLLKRDKIWPRASFFDHIASSLGFVCSIFLAIFFNPITAGAAVIRSLAMTGVLFGSFAPSVFTFARHTDGDYKNNKKFIGMSIATWVMGVINIVLTILIGVL
jgi:hypothetical protein